MRGLLSEFTIVAITALALCLCTSGANAQFTAYVSYAEPDCKGEVTLVQTLFPGEAMFGSCDECFKDPQSGRENKIICNANAASIIPKGYAAMYTYDKASSESDCTLKRLARFFAAKPNICVTADDPGSLNGGLVSFMFDCNSKIVTRSGNSCNGGNTYQFSGDKCQKVSGLPLEWARLDCSLKGGIDTKNAASRLFSYTTSLLLLACVAIIATSLL